MRIAERAQIHVPRPIEEVFDFSVACETFPRVLQPLGPIAGVAKAEMIDAPAPKTGARRRIHMTDGSAIEELLVAFERPTRHRYRWLNRPAPPFSWLVRGGEGDWTFTPSDGGTSIVWVYSFDLTTPLAYPLAAPIALLFRRWMTRGLVRIRAVLRGEL